MAQAIDFVDFIRNNAQVGPCIIVADKVCTFKVRNNPLQHLVGQQFVKRTVYIGAGIGYDYQSRVENAQERSGGERGYECGASQFTYFDKFFNTNKSGEKYYLKVMNTNKQLNLPFATIKTLWYYEGQEIDLQDIEPAVKAADLPHKTIPTRQIEQGVAQENVLDYKCITAENVVYFKQGTLQWKGNLTIELPTCVKQ